MIIDCIADLHGYRPYLPGGDMLIIAGDLTARDTFPQLKEFFDWFEKLDYRKKILIGGNHDKFLQQCISSDIAEKMGIREEFHHEYLCDSGTEYEGLKIWGAPWSKWFAGVNPFCDAFMFPSAQQMKDKWDLIPEDIDILVTHTPAYRILDGERSPKHERRFGCHMLEDRLPALNNLKLHVFGHIHEGYGTQDTHRHCTSKETFLSVNCAHMNVRYDPDNAPIRVEIKDGKASVISPGI
jgi:Icc-related predicted phosphoesterase